MINLHKNYNQYHKYNHLLIKQQNNKVKYIQKKKNKYHKTFNNKIKIYNIYRNQQKFKINYYQIYQNKHKINKINKKYYNIQINNMIKFQNNHKNNNKIY